MEKLLTQVAKYASAKGLKSFMLSVKDGELITFHMQNLDIKSALAISISAFHQVLNIELEKHPEYSEEHKNAIRAIMNDMNNLVKASDARLIEVRQRNP